MTTHASSMELLPDEIWSQIFCKSTKEEGGLGALDLCALAVVSKRARRISSESKVWRPLLERDFSSENIPWEESEVDAKTLYTIKHEEEKGKRKANRRRQIMGLESSKHSTILLMLSCKKTLENERAAAAEIRRRLCALHMSRVVQQVLGDLTAEVNSLKLELQERYHFIVAREESLECIEKAIRYCQHRLEVLYKTPTNLIGGTSSSKVKMHKKFNIHWLSSRQAKRANMMTQ